LKVLFTIFNKTSYLIEEVNCTEPFPRLAFPASVGNFAPKKRKKGMYHKTFYDCNLSFKCMYEQFHSSCFFVTQLW